MILALRTKADRAVLAGFGGVMCLVAVLYIRDPFALGFSIGTGAAMIATAWYLRPDVSDLVLRVIGLTSMIYVPFDIFDDTIRRSGARSDAFMLAEEFGGSTMLWGGIWLVLSCMAIALCLRHWLGGRQQPAFSQSSPLTLPPGTYLKRYIQTVGLNDLNCPLGCWEQQQNGVPWT